MEKWFRQVYIELFNGTPIGYIRIYENKKGQIHLCIDQNPRSDTLSILFEEYIKKERT